MKRLKTLRHPSVLTYVHSVESAAAVLLATEPAAPLQEHLEQDIPPLVAALLALRASAATRGPSRGVCSASVTTSECSGPPRSASAT